MRVLVTGGSGFVGSHIVATLATGGHEVRVLARDPDRLMRSLAPHGPMSVDVARGDVTDAGAVEAAVDGCSAVIHAANVFTFDPRHGAEMLRTNVDGTEIVLQAARRARCDPIVHVSTTLVLYPSDGPIPADPPLGANDVTAYVSSKLGAERIARRHQQEGAPVVTTYPGGVYGPLDPGPGEMVHVLRVWLGNQSSFRLGGRPAIPMADVRWVARAHAALLTPGAGPRRVTMSGRYVAWQDIFRVLRTLTGRRLPLAVPTPRWAAAAIARAADGLQPRIPGRLPFSYEQTWLLYASAPTDDSVATSLAGPPPPLEETLGDAIRWAVEAGHLPAKSAGRAVSGMIRRRGDRRSEKAASARPGVPA